MYSTNDIELIRGAVAHDNNGEKIGNVGEVYLDDQTGQPMWVTVNTGFFGMRTSFVPLDGSKLDGERLVLAHDKDLVKGAPQVDEDGHLDRAQEDELYRYYHLESGAVADDRLRTRRWEDAGTAGAAGAVGAAGVAGAAGTEEAEVADVQHTAADAVDISDGVGEVVPDPVAPVRSRGYDAVSARIDHDAPPFAPGQDDVDDRGLAWHRRDEVEGNRYYDERRRSHDPLIHNDRDLDGRVPHDRHDGPIYDREADGRGPRGAVQDANRRAREGEPLFDRDRNN